MSTSRRDFIKGAAIAGVGSAAFPGDLSACSQQECPSGKAVHSIL